MTSSATGEVRIRKQGACGRITLDRPRAINALSPVMVGAVDAALAAWAVDPAIHFVLLDGAGDRGLCAGGDIRAMYTAVTAGELHVAADFFRDEYRLNLRIARFPTPYGALMAGRVMGGGIGIAAHGSHRVVTERSALAMPETIIGFMPDAGGSHLLGAAPDELGIYLGLTGNRFGAADALGCGFADLMVPSAALPALTGELEACLDAAAMERCLGRYAAKPEPGRLAGLRGSIRACFAGNSVEAILEALTRDPDAWAAETLAELQTRSPTSLKVTLRALRNTRAHGDLRFSLIQEYRVACRAIREHDFVEGVRAAVVDKDRRPRWHPDRLDAVTDEAVARYFVEPEGGDLDFPLDGGL